MFVIKYIFLLKAVVARIINFIPSISSKKNNPLTTTKQNKNNNNKNVKSKGMGWRKKPNKAKEVSQENRIVG